MLFHHQSGWTKEDGRLIEICLVNGDLSFIMSALSLDLLSRLS